MRSFGVIEYIEMMKYEEIKTAFTEAGKACQSPCEKRMLQL